MHFNVQSDQLQCPWIPTRLRTAMTGQKLQPEYKNLSPMLSSFLYLEKKLGSYDNNCPMAQIKAPRSHHPPPFHEGVEQGLK